MEDRMAVRPDDLCELTCLGATDDGQLPAFVMRLQKASDVCPVGHGVDVHVGMALLPLLHVAVEAVAVADD